MLINIKYYQLLQLTLKMGSDFSWRQNSYMRNDENVWRYNWGPIRFNTRVYDRRTEFVYSNDAHHQNSGRWAYNKMIYITKQFICADSWRGGDAERPAAACYFMHCQSALYAELLSIRGVSSPTLYRTQTTRFNTIRHSTLRLIFERPLYVFSPSFYLHLYSVFILQLLNGSPFLVHFFLFILGRAVD